METLEKLPSEMNEVEFQQWLEMHPVNTERSEDGEYLHVPIAYLEPDLRFTFNGQIQITVVNCREMFGAVMMQVRLKVYHPVHKIWQKYDGMAAVNIQATEAGEWKGTEKTRVVDDMKTGVPSCYSVAIQNAAKKIGRRFGSDINRINKPGQTKEAKEEVKRKHVDDRVLILINDCSTIMELNDLIPTLPSSEEVQTALNKKLTELKKTIKKKKP